jgi:hypothetical protein
VITLCLLLRKCLKGYEFINSSKTQLKKKIKKSHFFFSNREDFKCAMKQLNAIRQYMNWEIPASTMKINQFFKICNCKKEENKISKRI